MSNTRRGSNPSFGTPVPRVGQRGGTSYDAVGKPGNLVTNSNSIKAAKFNSGVIE